MAILSKGTTFSSGQSVTANDLNALVDSASFNALDGGAADGTTLKVHGSGYLEVKDGGITNAKLAPGAVNASSIGSSTITETQLANDAVTSLKLADGAVTAPKISATDTNFNFNATHDTLGLGILANASSSSPKIKMDGGVRIGDVAPTVAGELEVTGNGGANILVVENTSTTATDQSILTVRGPQTTIQMKDTVAPANQGIYNITCDGGYLQINLISDDGSTTTGLLRLRPNGDLSIAGTLDQGGLT